MDSLLTDTMSHWPSLLTDKVKQTLLQKIGLDFVSRPTREKNAYNGLSQYLNHAL